jgi:hypothetical protein
MLLRLIAPLSLLAALSVAAAPASRVTETQRFVAAEARQGVAADAEFLYVISNHAVGKYRKSGGERIASWECPEGEPLIHLNAGVVFEGRLYCAHSNFPGVPHVSSVEIWDTNTLRHVGSRSLGRTDGSLTWIDRRNGRWIAAFVHYGGRGGEPGRGPEWTRIVEFDDEWRETGGWTLPAELVVRLGTDGYSTSGGALGPGGLLYLTGHDAPELYVLSFPSAGSVLRWIATLPIPAEGQAFGWDPVEPSVAHFVLKRTREVITVRMLSPGA